MSLFNLPRIGLRTIKTAIGIFLCLLLIPNEPFFACITVVFCLQDTVSNSIDMAINRIIGTILGGALGLLFLYFFRFLTTFIDNLYLSKLIIYLIIALGIVVVIYLCNFFKRPGSINVSCIVFLAITTTYAYSTPFDYAINRIFETILGIIIAILVNKFINPPTENIN